MINGDQGFDSIDGGEGNDTIDGGNQDDTLIGSLGDDVLIGEQGFDVLEGGEDDDTLDGGKQSDLLTGGSGSDIFILSNVAGTDTITDFELGSDTIGLGDGITYEDLSFSGESDTSIVYRNKTIATVSAISPESLDSRQFSQV